MAGGLRALPGRGSEPASDAALSLADSTNQYIRGQASVAPIGGICPSGLRSALVLIGAYDRSSGDPVLGVINEPFFREDPLTHRYLPLTAGPSPEPALGTSWRCPWPGGGLQAPQQLDLAGDPTQGRPLGGALGLYQPHPSPRDWGREKWAGGLL